MSLVVITGASGLLGGNLAAELRAAGHDVAATRRAGTKVAHLDDLKLEWRDADLGSPAALAYFVHRALRTSKQVRPSPASAPEARAA